MVVDRHPAACSAGGDGTRALQERGVVRVALTVTWLAILVISLLATAQAAPQVRQPDDASFSSEEKASLARGIEALESILAEPYWGSGVAFGGGGWGSREFSIYAAGVLLGRGYSVTLVKATEPGSDRFWLLVGVPLGDVVAWVPVEPSPGPGRPQLVLGRVPGGIDAGGIHRFPQQYVEYGSVVPLPPNAPPLAAIRLPATRPMPNQMLRLLAFGSSDPDGAIVLYRWNFGDGTTAVYSDENAYHTYSAAGTYTIVLTVIDNGGRSSTATLSLTVGSDAPTFSEMPKPDCGCGK